MTTVNIHFVDEPGSDAQATINVHADNLPEGGDTYTLPAATTNALGGVKKASAVAAVAAADAAAATGEAPTKSEFDKVVTELNETKRQLNALLSGLKASGVTA